MRTDNVVNISLGNTIYIIKYRKSAANDYMGDWPMSYPITQRKHKDTDGLMQDCSFSNKPSIYTTDKIWIIRKAHK